MLAVWNGLFSQRKPCVSAAMVAICVFMGSRSVDAFTLEVSWQRFLVFLWLMTKGEREI